MTERTRGVTAKNELAALVGPFWSRAKTCHALDLSEDEVANLRDQGGILEVLTADSEPFYPGFQFERIGDDVQVRPAVAAVTRVLRRFDPWSVAVLLHTSAPELDGATPLEWLEAGRATSEVEELARLVAREWSAG